MHKDLWDAENVFRSCGRQEEFGPTFLSAARIIIAHNERRATLKRSINMHMKSSIIEVKSYEV